VLPYLREVAVRTVHPVIQSPTQAVDAVLRVDFAETSEEHLLLVRLAVTIGVLGVKNVRGASDQHAFAPGHDAGWIFESVETDGGLVVLAVAFSALQALDPAARLPLVVETERIVNHLDDPELAIGSPVERDGALHQRLGGDQLDGETGARPEGSERLFRTQRRGSWLRSSVGDQLYRASGGKKNADGK